VRPTRLRRALVALLLAGACSPDREPSPERSPDAAVAAGLDSLGARLVRAYRTKDARAYGALYTDSALFEWPAVPTARGRAAMEAMARELWPPLAGLDIRFIVSSRRIAPDHATEFGAFEESWRDTSGARMTEYGRYVTLLARQSDGAWRIDRFFGFSDSTARAPAKR
jgi:ketosteroid isomerase-like protein